MFYPVILNNLQDIQTQVMSIIELNYDIEKTIFDCTDNPEKYFKLPAISEVITSLNLQDVAYSITVNITNHRTSAIHIDHGKFKYSLNIPILNTKNTFLTFYNLKDGVPPGGKLMSPPGKTLKYYGFDEEDILSIAQKIETTQPGFVDTSVPHSFESHNPQSRIMLLIRLLDEFKPPLAP